MKQGTHGNCDGASECKWPVTLNKPMDTCLMKHRAYKKKVFTNGTTMWRDL